MSYDNRFVLTKLLHDLLGDAFTVVFDFEHFSLWRSTVI